MLIKMFLGAVGSLLVVVFVLGWLLHSTNRTLEETELELVAATEQVIRVQADLATTKATLAAVIAEQGVLIAKVEAAQIKAKKVAADMNARSGRVEVKLMRLAKISKACDVKLIDLKEQIDTMSAADYLNIPVPPAVINLIEPEKHTRATLLQNMQYAKRVRFLYNVMRLNPKFVTAKVKLAFNDHVNRLAFMRARALI